MSVTASIWLILCASLVCVLFSSKLVIVVVFSLKEVCEFIITYNCMFLCSLLVPRTVNFPVCIHVVNRVRCHCCRPNKGNSNLLIVSYFHAESAKCKY